MQEAARTGRPVNEFEEDVVFDDGLRSSASSATPRRSSTKKER